LVLLLFIPSRFSCIASAIAIVIAIVIVIAKVIAVVIMKQRQKNLPCLFIGGHKRSHRLYRFNCLREGSTSRSLRRTTLLANVNHHRLHRRQQGSQHTRTTIDVCDFVDVN
jgi:hypothetical protein